MKKLLVELITGKRLLEKTWKIMLQTGGPHCPIFSESRASYKLRTSLGMWQRIKMKTIIRVMRKEAISLLVLLLKMNMWVKILKFKKPRSINGKIPRTINLKIK